MAYLLHILVLVCIYGALAVSLDLLIGHLGIFSLSHAAFFGIGAYTLAILTRDLGIPTIPAAFLAMVAAAVVGLVAGLPSLRVRDDYFVIVSFAFQVVVFTVMNNWTSLTGGALGFTGIPVPTIAGWRVDTPAENLLLAAAMLGLVCLAVQGLVSSPFGRLMTAVREDELLVLATGRKPGKVKLEAFVVSAGLAALAGAVYAGYMGFIDPTSFQVMESVMILCMVVIGGSGRIAGSLLGAVLLIVLPELLRFIGLPGPVVGHVRRGLYGLILVFVLLVRPKGLIGAGLSAKSPERGEAPA